MAEASDEALYQALSAGDMAAFEELYRRYEGPLFGFIVRQLGDHAEAEDVFHEAFMAVLKERRGTPELASFRAWIFRVAQNLCLNRVRSRQRARRAVELEHRSAIQPVAAAPLIDEAADASEAPIALERAVAKLPEPLAQLYALRVAGLSYDEIARVLRIPLGTVKSRIHDMVSRLRKELRAWTAS